MQAARERGVGKGRGFRGPDVGYKTVSRGWGASWQADRHRETRKAAGEHIVRKKGTAGESSSERVVLGVLMLRSQLRPVPAVQDLPAPLNSLGSFPPYFPTIIIHTPTHLPTHTNMHMCPSQGVHHSLPRQPEENPSYRTPALEGDWRAVTLNETGSFDYYKGVGILSIKLQLCFKN